MNLYGCKVLLVDDEKALRDMVSGFLRRAGFHNVTVAANCLEAEELFALKDLVKPLFDKEGKTIYGTGLNETENKIFVYVGVNADLEALYKLVPEDAVSIQFMYGGFQVIDL